MLKHKYAFLIAIVTIVVALDQYTKALVVKSLILWQSIPVIPNYFSLTHVHNPGVAFGTFADLNPSLRIPFLIGLPIVILTVVLYTFHKLRPDQKFSLWALPLIIGGAIGNLIDRARLAYVIDFLDFHWYEKYHFHVFNIADSAVSVGVALLLLASFFEKESPDLQK